MIVNFNKFVGSFLCRENECQIKYLIIEYIIYFIIKSIINFRTEEGIRMKKERIYIFSYFILE